MQPGSADGTDGTDSTDGAAGAAVFNPALCWHCTFNIENLIFPHRSSAAQPPEISDQ